MAQSNLLNIGILDVGRHVYVQDITNPEVRMVCVVYANRYNTAYLFDQQDPSVTFEVELESRQKYGILQQGWVIDAVVHQITGEITWLNPITNEMELP